MGFVGNIIFAAVAIIGFVALAHDLQSGEMKVPGRPGKHVRRPERPYVFAFYIAVRVIVCASALYMALFWRFSCRLTS